MCRWLSSSAKTIGTALVVRVQDNNYLWDKIIVLWVLLTSVTNVAGAGNDQELGDAKKLVKITDGGYVIDSMGDEDLDGWWRADGIGDDGIGDEVLDV